MNELLAREQDGDPHFIIDGDRVCRPAFLASSGISRDRWTHIVRLADEGAHTVLPPIRNRCSPHYDFVVGFLSDFFEIWSHPMPNCTQERRLDRYIRLSDIVAEAQAELELMKPWFESRRAISASLVSRVWKERFKHVTQPHLSEYGCCARCAGFRRRLAGARAADKPAIQQEYDKHILHFCTQRSAVAREVYHALHHPAECIYVQVDLTMPQQLPNFRPRLAVCYFLCLRN